MLTQTAQVVMLPQDKQDWNKGDLVIDIYGLCIAEHESHSESPKWKAQHIYFTTDEPIQEGDWFTNTELSKLYKATCYISDNDIECEINDCYVPKRYARKIIASTDPALDLPDIPTTWIRDVYVPSNGSIKEVDLETFLWDYVNQDDGVVETTDKLKLTDNNEVCIVSEIQKKN